MWLNLLIQTAVIWFDEILNINEEELLPRLNEIINPVYYVVAGDAFNLSCVWLSHMFYKSSKNQ